MVEISVVEKKDDGQFQVVRKRMNVNDTFVIVQPDGGKVVLVVSDLDQGTRLQDADIVMRTVSCLADKSSMN